MSGILGAGTYKIELDGKDVANISVLTVNGNIMTKVFFRQLPEVTKEALDNGKFLGTVRLDEETYFPVIYKGVLYRYTLDKLNELCQYVAQFWKVKDFKPPITQERYERAVKNKMEATTELKEILYKMVLSQFASDICNGVPLDIGDILIKLYLDEPSSCQKICFGRSVGSKYTGDVSSDKVSYASLVHYYGSQILAKLGVDLSVQFEFNNKNILYELASAKGFGIQISDSIHKLIKHIDSIERDTGDSPYKHEGYEEHLKAHAQETREGLGVVLSILPSRFTNGCSEDVKIKARVMSINIGSKYMSRRFDISDSFELQFNIANNSLDLIYRELADHNVCGTEVEMIKLRRQFMGILNKQKEANAEAVSVYEEYLKAYQEEKRQWEQQQADIRNRYINKRDDALTRIIMVGRDLV